MSAQFSQMQAQQKVQLAKTSAAGFIIVYASQDVYHVSGIPAERESFAGLRLRQSEVAVIGLSQESWDEHSRIVSIGSYPSPATIFAVPHHGSYAIQSVTLDVEQHNRALAQRLCEDHPDISTDPDIFGGNPHIKNVRLTVGNILAKLYNYGSISAVASIYKPHVNEDQIKEAIAYAQDFLEAAIHPNEPSQIDG